MLQVLITIIYGVLILPARAWALVTGRDPLQRKLAPERESYWLPLPAKSGMQSFFSEDSDYAKGDRARLSARWATGALAWLARFYGPREGAGRAGTIPLRDDLPDEIYTLW